jgi:hypothetical protein
MKVEPMAEVGIRELKNRTSETVRAVREGARLITWDSQQRGRAAGVVETLTPTEALAVLEWRG